MLNHLSRTTALKIAATLSFAIGLFELILFLPLLTRGAAEVEQDANVVPYGVILAGFILAILRVVAAYGTWKNQRWGIVVILLTSAIDALLAVPGVLFAPTTEFWISSTVVVILSILTCGLCLWRDRKATLV